MKAKDDLYHKREELNREIEQTRTMQSAQERRLDKREDGLEEQNQSLQKKERALEHTQRKLTERRTEIERRGQEAEELVKAQTQKLHEISGLSRDQGEVVLLERGYEPRVGADSIAGRLRAAMKRRCGSQAREKARRVLATAIHRYAAVHTADTTVSTVDIPSDDMKGRIIGREGRNIRAPSRNAPAWT